MTEPFKSKPACNECARKIFEWKLQIYKFVNNLPFLEYDMLPGLTFLDKVNYFIENKLRVFPHLCDHMGVNND